MAASGPQLFKDLTWATFGLWPGWWAVDLWVSGWLELKLRTRPGPVKWPGVVYADREDHVGRDSGAGRVVLAARRTRDRAPRVGAR